MKRIAFILCFIVSGGLEAQDCAGYYFMQGNKTVEMTLYKKDGDENGKQVYTVSNVSKTATGMTSVVNSELFNKKGKSTAKGTNNMECTGGVFKVDLKMMIAPEQQKQLANGTAQGENMYLEYPSTMKAGDDLKDGNMHLDMKVNNMDETVDLNIISRKVTGKESVTSPAGTWDCFRITFVSKMQIKVMGIGVPVTIEGTEWYAPGFGVVKSESKYGTTLITSIK
ncbi:MAG TPA: hypothetical protein VGO45_14710 [Bacteroidia bacterium]|jgi:hypothetical protein|nr:hypothetical protein [Bacteroidia bacterium]